jgi:hypothetical protein
MRPPGNDNATGANGGAGEAEEQSGLGSHNQNRSTAAPTRLLPDGVNVPINVGITCPIRPPNGFDRFNPCLGLHCAAFRPAPTTPGMGWCALIERAAP